MSKNIENEAMFFQRQRPAQQNSPFIAWIAAK
jgi:hypothetical protein